MLAILLPLAIALFAWWFSTGAILWLVRGRHLMAIASTPQGGALIGALLGGVAIAGLGLACLARDDLSVTGAYQGFFAALLVWAAVEIGFLTGRVTGPNQLQLPAQARGWHRFKLASATVLHHEGLIVLLGLSVLAVCWGQANAVAVWVYLALAMLRLSAKLNLFLGVRFAAAEFLPARLHYLASYFRIGRASPLLPLSTLGWVAVTLWLANCAFEAQLALDTGAALGGNVVWSQIGLAGTGQASALWLVTALVGLGALEHLFLLAPIGEAALWRWALRSGAEVSAPVQTDADAAQRGRTSLSPKQVNNNHANSGNLHPVPRTGCPILPPAREPVFSRHPLEAARE